MQKISKPLDITSMMTESHPMDDLVNSGHVAHRASFFFDQRNRIFEIMIRSSSGTGVLQVADTLQPGPD